MYIFCIEKGNGRAAREGPKKLSVLSLCMYVISAFHLRSGKKQTCTSFWSIVTKMGQGLSWSCKGNQSKCSPLFKHQALQNYCRKFQMFQSLPHPPQWNMTCKQYSALSEGKPKCVAEELLEHKRDRWEQPSWSIHSFSCFSSSICQFVFHNMMSYRRLWGSMAWPYFIPLWEGWTQRLYA